MIMFALNYNKLNTYIYDTCVTITHDDIYHNVIVNHLGGAYSNLIN
jgi:hypothetical protein